MLNIERVKVKANAALIGLLGVLVLGGCSADWRGYDDLSLRYVFGTAAVGHEDPYEKGKRDLAAGRYGLALEAFQLARARQPDSADVLNAIGVTYDHIGRHDLSNRYYRMALLKAPMSAEVLNNLGFSHLSQGNVALAQLYLSRAQQEAAGNPVIAANRGLAARSVAGGVNAPQPDQGVAHSLGVAAGMKRVAVKHDGVGVKRLANAKFKVVTLPVEPLPSRPQPQLPKQTLTQRQSGADGEDTAPGQSIGNSREPQPTSGDRQPAIISSTRTLEVSNGTGRRRMAKRFSVFLGFEGLRVDRLTNAVSYSNRRTVIYFRKGLREEAMRLTASLPGDVEIRERTDQRSDLRIVLGADLLAFDAELIKRT